jgi:2,4-dienoyl-CoA reductase-like NADH-dependent reductase (Old Yellow Enzyme family)
MRAGFDGVELHAGSGWLPHQFLDTTSNHRTDEWGGCRENRLRFTREVLREIVDVCGAERVGVRLSPGGGYNDMGMPLQETLETFRALIRELVAMHVAYVELMR